MLTEGSSGKKMARIVWKKKKRGKKRGSMKDEVYPLIGICFRGVKRKTEEKQLIMRKREEV